MRRSRLHLTGWWQTLTARNQVLRFPTIRHYTSTGRTRLPSLPQVAVSIATSLPCLSSPRPIRPWLRPSRASQQTYPISISRPLYAITSWNPLRPSTWPPKTNIFTILFNFWFIIKKKESFFSCVNYAAHKHHGTYTRICQKGKSLRTQKGDKTVCSRFATWKLKML